MWTRMLRGHARRRGAEADVCGGRSSVALGMLASSTAALHASADILKLSSPRRHQALHRGPSAAPGAATPAHGALGAGPGYLHFSASRNLNLVRHVGARPTYQARDRTDGIEAKKFRALKRSNQL